MSRRGFPGPRSNSRKGLVLRCQRLARAAFDGWRPHRGDWQPDPKLRERTKHQLADLRAALDELEAKL